MSEEQLLLLNCLIYSPAFSMPENEKKTIGEILKGPPPTNGEAATTDEEWQALWEAAKADPYLCSLTMANLNVEEETKAVMACFVDPSGQAIVVFMGTADEWADNVRGAEYSDTEQQRRALEWFESLPYEDIIVTGHSKGGNKAMYVTILSTKASACFSFDGQGFSNEFIEKYGDLIDERSGLIHSRSHYRDFVNILLYSIAGDASYYKNGFGIGGFSEYHAPISMFCWEYNTATGEWELQLSFGEAVPRSPAMDMLNGFTVHLVSNVSGYKRIIMVEAFAQLVAVIFDPESSGWDIGLQALIHNEQIGQMITELRAYLKELKKSDPEAYEVMLEDLYAILVEAMGVEAANEVMFLFEDPGKMNTLFLLTAVYNASKTKSTLRDFSEDTKQLLLNTVDEVSEEPWWNITRWDVWYSISGLFGGLNVEDYTDKMDEYFRKVIDVNDATRETIENIFSEVYSLDEQYSATMQEKTERLNELSVLLEGIAESLVPSA